MWSPLTDQVTDRQALLDDNIRRLLDRHRAGGGRIFCARGCRNCCTLEVRCTFTEALLVAAAMSEEHVVPLEDYVVRLLRSLDEAGDLKSFLRLRRRLGSCSFLEADGACGVYPARPFSCRSLLSTRPADWCAIDFADLHPLEKEAYLSSLAPAVVDFPTHYLAASRDLATTMESESALEMAALLGFRLSGDLPFLVWLERRYRLSEEAASGFEAVAGLLEREGLDLPFLISLER